jgi:hypothetical protein
MKPVYRGHTAKGIGRATVGSVLALLLATSQCNAIVVRHDIADSAYRTNIANYPTLALLPDEGHGILVAKEWIVTAAHAVLWRPVKKIELNGIYFPVQKIIVHPGYKPVPDDLKTGDAAPLMDFMASSDDIALIKLAHPVKGTEPTLIYRGSDEMGKTAEIVGRGATGNGLVGQYPKSPHDGALRRAFSRVVTADQRWLGLKFGPPDATAFLEGMPADGDSGAPIFIFANYSWQLAGIVSHKFATGRLSDFRCCRYGQITYQVRISRYANWIDSTIVGN